MNQIVTYSYALQSSWSAKMKPQDAYEVGNWNKSRMRADQGHFRRRVSLYRRLSERA